MLSEILKCVAENSKLQELALEAVGFSRHACRSFGDDVSLFAFKAMEIFTSLSLPHEALARFLPRQQSLKILNVGDTTCGRACPLRLRLAQDLVSVRCAASCAASIIPEKPLFHARIIDDARSRNDYALFLGIFDSLRSTTASLTRLDLTFPSSEMDILSLVVSAAPQVVHLSLSEIIDVTEVRICSKPRSRIFSPEVHLAG